MAAEEEPKTEVASAGRAEPELALPDGHHAKNSRRIFSDSVQGEVEKIKEKIKQAIDTAQYGQFDCAMIEHLMIRCEDVQHRQASANKCRVLDCSGPSFSRLTDAGLVEISKIFPAVGKIY